MRRFLEKMRFYKKKKLKSFQKQRILYINQYPKTFKEKYIINVYDILL